MNALSDIQPPKLGQKQLLFPTTSWWYYCLEAIMNKINEILSKLVNAITEIAGKPVIFALAAAMIATWFIVGILFKYDELWFNILDVFVFLTTFFLVFVVQSTQNADTKAIQDKLDEIIDSLPRASNKKKAEEKVFKSGKKKI
ncbi:hypothetical protein EOM57_04850 [Candidatus Saccharibacteria bacterium]|nr:hypothetical protein [Candidatus Saccharibacteria bacterium]NCU43972.1 hypothetical protein [Candidatus Saccharibacteria bacterium]